MARMTITLDDQLAARVREAGNGNVSRFVSEAILESLEQIRRRKLREALAEGCIANAEEDLAICREWDYVQWEADQMADDV